MSCKFYNFKCVRSKTIGADITCNIDYYKNITGAAVSEVFNVYKIILQFFTRHAVELAALS